MGRKKYSCDFETTTTPNDCRVWAYGWMEVGNNENYMIGNSIDEFMQWCENTKSDMYFHNLKFDGSFIINWLLRNGFEYSKKPREKTFNSIISHMGQWYMIDICYGYQKKRKLHTVFYDSMKKLPFSVKKIAQDFKMEILKGDLDYHTHRPPGHKITEEEHTYIKHDIEIIANALKIQFDQGLTKMTNGSDSLAGFKTSIDKKFYVKHFPILSLEINNEIRRYYRGGFTWLNEKYAEIIIENGLVYDVNSLYPSQMYSRPLPYGLPIFYTGKYKQDNKYDLYLQHIRCSFELRDDMIPTIQIKKNLSFIPNEYLKSSDGEIVDLYLTNVDLQLFIEHYYVFDLTYVDGWKFKSKTGLFKSFIDKWMHVKNNSTGAIKLLAKLMLNSLYGKFATNPNITGRIPYLKEDGVLGFKPGEEEFRDPVYTPVGVFITSWARYTTITTAQAVYDRIIYCDTDSIHLTGIEVPKVIEHLIDDKKLGYWQHEATFTRAKFLRQKTYIEEVDGKLNVRCSGMSEEVKASVDFENFKRGFSKKGNLKAKQVPGGVVLLDTEFTIK